MKYTTSDMMVITIARALKGTKNVFHGLASPIPMVAILLAKELNNDNMVYLNITGGVNIEPTQLEISTDGANLYMGTSSVFGLADIFDLSSRGELDVAFLSGVQIDKQARLNNSVIGGYNKPKVRLPGGAGSAVLVPTAKRAFIWRTKHDKRSFVEEVDFITSQGNVDLVFTPICVFEKVDHELHLKAISPFSSLSEIQESTGFEIKDKIYDFIEEPTSEELELLYKIDPFNIRSSEF